MTRNQRLEPWPPTIRVKQELNHLVGGSFCQKSDSHLLISSSWMERIFRLILGTLICKKRRDLCVFAFCSGGRTSLASIWSVSKTFVLGVRQKMAEFGPRCLVKTTIKTIFFANVGTSFYFLHFFSRFIPIENCWTNISPSTPSNSSTRPSKRLYSSPFMVRKTRLTLTDIPPTNQPSVQDGPLPSL